MTGLADDEHDLCTVAEIGDGERRTFLAGERSVLVLRIDGECHAVENLCTHARATLEHGRLRGFEITCPLHGARFDVRTGRCTAPPARRGVARFDLRIDNGRLIARVPAAAPRTPGFGPLN